MKLHNKLRLKKHREIQINIQKNIEAHIQKHCRETNLFDKIYSKKEVKNSKGLVMGIYQFVFFGE